MTTVRSGTFSEQGTTSSVVVSKPAGAASGDKLVVFIGTEDHATVTCSTRPTGFTRVGGGTEADPVAIDTTGADMRAFCYEKVLVAADNAAGPSQTFTFTMSASTYVSWAAVCTQGPAGAVLSTTVRTQSSVGGSSSGSISAVTLTAGQFAIAAGCSYENGGFNSVTGWTEPTGSTRMGVYRTTTDATNAVFDNAVGGTRWWSITLVVDVGVFAPSTVPNLASWVDSSDGATVTGSNPVTSWVDKSAVRVGAAATFEETGDPNTVTETLNGLTVMSLDGNDYFRGNTAFLYALGDFTALAVAKVDNTTGAACVMAEASTASANPTIRMGSLNGDSWFEHSNDAGVTEYQISSVAVDDGQPHLFRWVDSATVASLTVDGGTTVTSAAYVRSATTMNNPGIGCNPRSTADGIMTGYIAEIVVYSRVLTAGEIIDVETYLTDKWLASDSVVLVVADTLHDHSVDNVALTQHNVLVVADAAHGSTSDAVALTQHNTLAVDDTTQAHSVDNVDLIQHYTLTVADTVHGHTVDATVLTQHNTLAVADALHAHDVDNLVLSGSGAIVPDDTTHAHTVDNLTLVQHHVLVVAETSHAHTVDNLVFVDPTLILTDDRVLVVRAEDRTYRIAAESRTLTVPAADRTLLVEALT